MNSLHDREPFRDGKAKWIWDGGDPRKRNHWVILRKSFMLSEPADEALLHITADSKYVAYVNGTYIGMGPVRGWPSAPFYDTYDIREYLQPQDNVVAILVQHYGISTFQYLEGRGGLLAQLVLSVGGGMATVIGSDSSWRVHSHDGYARSAERICCQLAWTEIYDANGMDEGWKDREFDDRDWDNAIELGSDESLPWLTVTKRDIPHLQEVLTYPRRIEGVRRVVPRGQPVSLDLQPNFFPDSRDANPRRVLGLVACHLVSPKEMSILISFPWDSWLSAYGSIAVNGIVYKVPPSREVAIHLREGANLCLLRISEPFHLGSVFFHIDAEQPVSFVVPEHPEISFVTVGPFRSQSLLQLGEKIPRQEEPWDTDERFERAWQAKEWGDLLRYSEYIRPIAPEQICLDNVYMPNRYKDVKQEFQITPELQHMIMPNSSYSILNPDDSGDIEVLLDFGQEVTGYIQFELEAAQGTVVDCYGVERVGADLVPEHTEGMNNTLRYVARSGKQSYRSLVRRGFRYLYVTFRNARAPVKVYGIQIQFSTYPVTSVGRMECSDWKLNRIWEISQQTLLACMEDTFVDCPVYEQTFWVGDARNVSLVNYYNYGSYPLIRRCLRLVAGSLQRSPITESQVPSGWQNVLSAWSLLWVAACKEYYVYAGDDDFLKEMYPSLKANMEGFVSRLNDRDLLQIDAWNMLEWAAMDTPDDGIVTHLNASLVSALESMASIANWLTLEQDAALWKQLAEKITKAINRWLWDETKQAYVDCLHADGTSSNVFSMQTQVMVYLANCAEGIRKQKLEHALKQPPDSFVQIVNPFMLFFYFEALSRIDRQEQIVERIGEVWGQMIDEGTESCWETVSRPNMVGPTRSYCHAWSTAPGYFLGSQILGVRPLTPGFTKALIDPKPCHLKWARGSVPVPEGRIDVEWERTKSGVKLSYYAPEGIEVVLGEHVSLR
ncbi:family 78 glycoside hydrolase catalytic domain [Cohnella soli]|uniref:Family 78 glycoside hydrolase catalytic domain n=1 Tax=Cohnella soli TaxID=425005 RepID=A0ABW0HVZ4_9BACL